MSELIPVLMAGGYGKRLWPLSSKEVPKQFIKTPSSCYSFFQQSILRVKDNFPEIIIVINEEHRKIALEQIKEIKLKNYLLFIESESLNNFVPIMAICKYLEQKQNVKLVIFPTDHIIENSEDFISYIIKLSQFIRGKIVLFGIKPTRIEDSYGYIKIGDKNNDFTYKADRFIEKPPRDVAADLISTGKYVWNSGIFLFDLEFMLQECKIINSEITKQLEQIFFKDEHKEIFIKYPNINLPNISFDYAILEHTSNISVAMSEIKWLDAGSWNGLYQSQDKDEQKNVVFGNHKLKESYENYIYSDIALDVIGARNLAIVANRSGMIISSLESGKILKEEINKIWGGFEVIAKGEGYKIKILKINPNQCTSLQLHNFRSEYWFVLSGKAVITIDEQISYFSENEFVHIPQNVKHKIENNSNSILKLLEIQKGNYLEEDDITRFLS